MTAATAAELTIPARFNGPARSGNGGYTAGALAERVPDADLPGVEVTLRQPPPLDMPMSVHLLESDPRATGADRGAVLRRPLVAEARLVDAELEPVDGVETADRRGRDAALPGAGRPPVPDLLRVRRRTAPRATGCGSSPAGRRRPRPRRVAVGAAPEHGGSSDLVDDGCSAVGVAVTWAALDCVGGWSEDLAGRPMRARPDDRPRRRAARGRRAARRGRPAPAAATAASRSPPARSTTPTAGSWPAAEHTWIAGRPGRLQLGRRARASGYGVGRVAS